VNVLLISANAEQIHMPTLPLGLNCVAVAARNAGHEVRLLDLMGEENGRDAVCGVVDDLRPDLIGVSVRNVDDQAMAHPRFLLDDVKAVIALCRSVSDAPIVLGGAGYSMFPQSALAYLGADLGICGEGETGLPELLNRIQAKVDPAGSPGVYTPAMAPPERTRFAQNLDALPLPDPGFWPLPPGDAEEIWIPYQAKRGCPMDCSYCSTSAIEGRAIRRRRANSVVAGIARHVEAGFRNFYFVDNIFNLPPSFAREICQRLIAEGFDVSWRCILYPWKLDESLVRDMARAGCQEVSLGFESGCERILRSLNKKFHPQEVRDASALLADYGIRRTGFLLLGGPGETKASVEQSLTFADSLGLETVKLTVGIRIYPDTALAAMATREGLIEPDDDLLFPKFYVAREIEQWLLDTAETWLAERPGWFR
jgi:radical SAM superfamily enzyme YgiQ (UPF0313 family)